MKRINVNGNKQFPWYYLENKVWLQNVTNIKMTSIR